MLFRSVIMNPERRIVVPATWDRPAAPRRTAAVIQAEAAEADIVLRQRCESALAFRGFDSGPGAQRMRTRLEEEFEVVRHLGFAAYFLTVAEVVKLTRDIGVRVAARGSGAGSFINHLLGISVLNPLDFISVPAGVYRDFKNVGHELGRLLVMIQPMPGDTQDAVYHAESTGREIVQRWGVETLQAMSRIGVRFGEPAP